MRYGHFDDANQEYVITNPDTPMSWINYLGTSEYCCLISNNAAAYSFYKSSKSARMTRLRFNSIPTDRPGRYLYLRDHADGDYWSISWQPVGKPLNQFKSVCAHGPGYTRFESDYKGIKASARFFVPVDKPIEVWEVEIENRGSKPRELSLFSYAEWAFWKMDQDLLNFQYILYTCNMGYLPGVIDYRIKFWPTEGPKAFMATTLPVKSFDTDRDVFIGQYRHEGQPKAVERGECFGSVAVGGNPCAALQSVIKLKPGQTVRAVITLGLGDARKDGVKYRELYKKPAAAAADFAKVKAYWAERLEKYTVDTPDPLVNSMANIWNQVQCQSTFNWSRSASFNEAGGRDGMGYRDSHQDCLGVMHSIPKLAGEKIIDLLKGQHFEGCAMHHFQPLDWSQGPHNLQPRHEIYSDDHLWMLLSVPAYVKETGDARFVERVVPFADKGKATVWEHLRRAMDFSMKQRGPHGLLLGLRADWNDCINLRGKGESMFSTFLCLRGMNEFIELAERLGRKADAAKVAKQRAALLAAVEKHAWDGEWYLRGFLDSGRKLGGQSKGSAHGSKIFINSQTWAVMAGLPWADKNRKAMDSLHEHLATEHGIAINAPAYEAIDEEIGAVTSFPQGLKENGGIFCHANTWAVVAECLLGRGERAYELWKSFLPAAKNDMADVYTMEPYVYSQFITGPDHPNKFGRARNSWLTGTAAWGYVSLSQHMLGIRAGYDGLVVDPCIPKAWKGFSATRVYRGVTYEITVKNPRHVNGGVQSVKIGGWRKPGNVLPMAKPGSTVKVEVVLGE